MLKKAKKGQSLIEYGLIIALVAVVAVAVLTQMSQTVQQAGNDANAEVTNAMAQIRQL